MTAGLVRPSLGVALVAAAAVAAPPAPKTIEPTARTGHTAVWTGKAMIIWGGDEGDVAAGTGYMLDQAKNTWTRLPDAAPAWPRLRHGAVWTGREMIVWGGDQWSEHGATGSRFDPDKRAWREMRALPNQQGLRPGNTAVWTGREMIVWGGLSDKRVVWPGARYDPDADSWAPLSVEGAPIRREEHSAVWTGEEMIVWGGRTEWGSLRNGGRYDASKNAWRPMTSAGQDARERHTATWTGREMLVWGGLANGRPIASGARYQPRTDAWTPMSSNGAPSPASFHTAVWSGAELLVWTDKGEGGRYDPGTDTWRPMGKTGAPSPRASFTTVWTGREMVLWGGLGRANVPSDSGGAYDPGSDTWRPLGVDWMSRRARAAERALRIATVLPAAEDERCLAHGFGSDGRFAFTCTWIANRDYQDGPFTETWIVDVKGARERTNLGELEEKGIDLDAKPKVFGGAGPWQVGAVDLGFVQSSRLLEAGPGGERWATDAYVKSTRGWLRLRSDEHYDPPRYRALALLENPADGRLAVVAEVQRRSLEASFDRRFEARTFARESLHRPGEAERSFEPLSNSAFESVPGPARVGGLLGFSKNGRFAFVELRSLDDAAHLRIVNLLTDAVVHDGTWNGTSEMLSQNGIIGLDPTEIRASGPKLEHGGYSYVGEVRGNDLVVLRTRASGAAGWKRVGAAATAETFIAGWVVSPWEPRAALIVSDGQGLHVAGVHLTSGFRGP